MTARSVMLHVPEDVGSAIDEIASQTGQDISSLISEMLTEAVKMRRVPGIVFSNGATGRRARVAGSGLEVFEVIEGYVAEDKDWGRFREWFPWLDEPQLRAAIAYYEAYPEEIDERLQPPQDQCPTQSSEF